jgi:hypothetical protein
MNPWPFALVLTVLHIVLIPPSLAGYVTLSVSLFALAACTKLHDRWAVSRSRS